MNKEYDNKPNYCRKLGHEITFSYCRCENYNLPCRKIMDCWFTLLPIKEFINNNYSEEEKKTLISPSQNKITSILNIVQDIKNRENKKS